jgi:hypothetical protein
MDINICIDKLGLNANTYKLDQSVPPHSITEWTGDDTQPTQAELESAWTEYQAEQDSTQYQRDRQYAPTGDQLDMLWHAIDAGIDLKQSEFYTANKAVKDASPKP